MVLRIIVKIITLIIFLFAGLFAQNFNISSNFRIGLVEYEPGDWNSDQTALAELLHFIDTNTNIPIVDINRDVELKVKIGSNDFFKTKYLYMTGHGELRSSGAWKGIKLKKDEINNLELAQFIAKVQNKDLIHEMVDVVNF